MPRRWNALTAAAGAFRFGPGSRMPHLCCPRLRVIHRQATSATGADGIAVVEIYDTARQVSLPPAVFDLLGFARVPGNGSVVSPAAGVPTTPYSPATRAAFLAG